MMQGYNASVRYSDIKNVFGLIDPDSLNKASVEFADTSDISVLSQTNNGINNMAFKWATFEPEYWALDGSFDLIPADIHDFEIGTWKETLSDSDGRFQTNPIIYHRFTEGITAIGTTAIFDALSNEYAEEFIIKRYNQSGTEMTSDHVTNNKSAEYVSDIPIEDYWSLSIEVIKWGNPYRHIRISEILHGTIEVYDKSHNLISETLINEVDILSESIISSEVAFMINNILRRFNMYNPSGIYKYLVDAYPIDVMCGVGENKVVPYVNKGRYYYYKTETNDDEITALIRARDRLYTLDLTAYHKSRGEVITAYNMCKAILDDAGANNYNIDTALQSISLTNILNKMTHREALQKAVQAGMAVCYVDDKDVIQIKQIKPAESVITFDKNNCKSIPQPQITEYYNTVVVKTNNGKTDSADSDLGFGNIDMSKTNKLYMNYSSAVSGLSFYPTSGTVVSSENYLYYSILTLSGSGIITVGVRGRKISYNTTDYIINNGLIEPQRVYEINNELISSNDTADEVAKWALAVKQQRLSFNILWRGDPTIKMLDNMEAANRYGDSTAAVIIRNELIYTGGALSEITLARGGFN